MNEVSESYKINSITLGLDLTSIFTSAPRGGTNTKLMGANFKFWIKWPSFLGLVLYILFEVFVLKGHNYNDPKYKKHYVIGYASRNFYMKPCYYTDFMFKFKGIWITFPKDSTFEIGSKHIFEIAISDDLPDGAIAGHYQFPADSVPPEFLLTLPDTGWTTIPPKIK